MAIILHVEPNFISPYVFSCLVTLTEKNLPHEVKVLDTNKGETREAGYLAKTITGRVPTLDHDGFALGESTAIVEYLEETFPEPPVLPKATRDRARYRQLMSWMRSDETAPIREERSTVTIFYEPAKTPLSEKAKAAAQKLVEVADRVIRSENAPLFDAWCLADADLAFLLHRLIASGDPVTDRVRAWATREWKRPSVASFVAHERPKRG